MITFPLVRYVLTAAIRDKLIITLALMILLGSSISTFLGSAAVTEQQAFATVFGSGGLRFLGVVGIILFVCFYVRRAFENKEVEFLLSRPISRISYLLSHGLAFIILSLVISLVVVVSIAIIGNPDMGGLLVWGTSIVVEFAIMAIAALFFSMVLSSAAGAALACIGFYILARMMGTLLGIADVPADNMVTWALGICMEVISVIIPRFDMMGQVSWLVYGASDTSSIGFLKNAAMTETSQRFIEAVGLMGFIIFQGVSFIFLLLSAAAFDLSRRQF